MENNENKVVTRFAPSPTGSLHIGGIRTALYNYLFTRQNGGKFILRSEDTDKERSKKEHEDNIIESFKWLGLSYDEFYRQSERTEIYKKYLKQLIDGGFAYVSKEEVVAEGERSEVIRFKNPNKKIKFNDLVLGEIEFDTTDLKDFVIAKDMESPLYHLAVVVDDFEMGVTHVIRAQEHLSNTPRQILIQEAINAPRPSYAHIPIVLAPDKSKLSKRHGALSVLAYRDMGYLPGAILNFMALIGWNPGDEQEIFTLDELVKKFNLEKVQKAGGVFNTEKLDWVNKEHIKKLCIGFRKTCGIQNLSLLF
jgi:glutamyl/glutaminyl-tRNA synthetase